MGNTDGFQTESEDTFGIRSFPLVPQNVIEHNFRPEKEILTTQSSEMDELESVKNWDNSSRITFNIPFGDSFLIDSLGKENDMDTDDILKAYIDKANADQSSIRADIRANEMRMDERLNRIEDMIDRSQQETKRLIENQTERFEGALQAQENRLNGNLANLEKGIDAKITNLNEQLDVKITDLEKKVDVYTEEVKGVRSSIHGNTIAIVIGIAAMIIAVLFGLPGWLERFIQGMLVG